MEYDSIYEQILKGAIIRSKATWYEKGEKSNKYFLNLETHKKAKSSVYKVFNREGVLITDPKKILHEFLQPGSPQSIGGCIKFLKY